MPSIVTLARTSRTTPAQMMSLAGPLACRYGDLAVVFGKTGVKPERPSPL
jgi:hypothetical protein